MRLDLGFGWDRKRETKNKNKQRPSGGCTLTYTYTNHVLLHLLFGVFASLCLCLSLSFSLCVSLIHVSNSNCCCLFFFYGGEEGKEGFGLPIDSMICLISAMTKPADETQRPFKKFKKKKLPLFRPFSEPTILSYYFSACTPFFRTKQQHQQQPRVPKESNEREPIKLPIKSLTTSQKQCR